MNGDAPEREAVPLGIRLIDPLVWGPFILVTLIWGSTWLVIKDQISVVPPGWTIAYRFVLAALAMFALAAMRGDGWRLRPGGWGIAALLGVAQFVVNFQFVYRAELWLTSGVVAVAYALVIVPNALLARSFLGETLSRGFLAGSAVAIFGIALLFVHEARIAGLGSGVEAGMAYALLAMLGASVAAITQATPAAKRQPFLPLIAWAMAIGAAIDLLAAFALSGPPVWDDRWEYLAGIAYLAVAGSVVTFPLFFRLVRTIGASRAAYVGVAVPVVAMILSSLFEGYRWSLLAAGGAALALTGLVIALRSRR